MLITYFVTLKIRKPRLKKDRTCPKQTKHTEVVSHKEFNQVSDFYHAVFSVCGNWPSKMKLQIFYLTDKWLCQASSDREH